MMDQDRITQYIHSLDRGHGAFCDQIAKTARAGRVPVIRKETAVFLQHHGSIKTAKAHSGGWDGSWLFCPFDGTGYAGRYRYYYH